MAENTGISWCDATFNPWWGCQKVSPACDHCYAERDSKRFAPGRVLWGAGSERRMFGDAHWQAPLKWAKTMPAKLGRRPRVFCASMGDWLDLDAPIDQFVRLLDTIRLTPELDWLLLSKRIGNWRKRLTEARDLLWRGDPELLDDERRERGKFADDWLCNKPPANVWLGVTICNQEEADRDIPKLLAVPARVRFLSIEPMLGPVDLERPRPGPDLAQGSGRTICQPWLIQSGIDWVIVGGESGPHARPMHPDWPRSLRDQCAAAGVAMHFKQWGEWAPERGSHPVRHPVHDSHRWPIEPGEPAGGVWSYRIGKAAAGRLLDGREHNEFPQP